jgi:hypothetical protein
MGAVLCIWGLSFGDACYCSLELCSLSRRDDLSPSKNFTRVITSPNFTMWQPNIPGGWGLVLEKVGLAALAPRCMCKERVPRDTARYLIVYRSIPSETRGKDEDLRLYFNRRLQELLRLQAVRVQSIEVDGARVLQKGVHKRVNERVQ